MRSLPLITLLALACSTGEPRPLDTVRARFDSPTGNLATADMPKVMEASRHLRRMDDATAVLPYFAPTAAMNFSLSRTEMPSPYLCVESLAAVNDEDIEVAGSCLDKEKGAGVMGLVIERNGSLTHRILVEFDEMCVHGNCLTGAQAVRFEDSDFHQSAVSSMQVDVTFEGGSAKLDAGYRSRVEDDQVYWDWAIFTKDDDDGANVILSQRADVGAGELVATDATGKWDCSYSEAGGKGICQPQCSNPEIIARICCTCRRDEIENDGGAACKASCPEATPRRTVLW